VRFAGLSFAALVMLAAATADAHEVRGDVVFLDLGERAVGVEVQVPLSELALARHEEVAALTPARVAPDAAYISLAAPDGRPFAREAEAPTFEQTPHGEVATFRLRFTPPEGAGARTFTLREDVVLHEVVNANVFVFVRRDLQAGAFGDSPTLAGALHYQQRSLDIVRDAGAGRAVAAAFRLGLDHIREGTDHLLFLVLLLVVAPLAGTRRALGRTAKIATAFTLGHSLTLALGAVCGSLLPARLVESLIAVSILATAAHAWRPRFAGKEWLLAGGFGLVHGLAFASALAGFGFDGHALVLALLGFNLGVEAMQLVAIALVVPSLLVIARGPLYPHLRRGIAAIGGIAALAWLADRALGLHTPIPRLVERAGQHGLAIALLLGVVAVASLAITLSVPKEQRA
jgi:hypothetical protein